ncbi:hypothetical protein ABW17_02885 [Mycobacterium nebraskense]|uniref:PPE family protein, SVP subgroup n=1 Tax=Mycobacterium nebraskense TaxID=244292 RepID=UPI000641BE4F|nr:PE domain-containing protein [Mycobacterium nebraskense]KLO46783.1 hypothetical protein ABW17_02885 [Mycobacterium nebraskense]
MSFVIAQPEALTVAASKLQGIGSSMAAQDATAAAPTTGVIPAAADPVSAVQAGIFSAYGSQYQSVAAQAQAIHELLVSTLGTNAGMYGTTEAANAAAASSGSGFSIIGQLTQFGQFGLIPGALNNGSLIGIQQMNTFGTGASGLFSWIALGSADSTTVGAESLGAEGLGSGGMGALPLAGAVRPAGPAGPGGAPVLADMGRASSVGGLSVPASWASEASPPVNPAPAILAGGGSTGAAPQTAPATTIPAGMPSVATVGKSGALGAPRYGVKPTVMPKPALV